MSRSTVLAVALFAALPACLRSAEPVEADVDLTPVETPELERGPAQVAVVAPSDPSDEGRRSAETPREEIAASTTPMSRPTPAATEWTGSANGALGASGEVLASDDAYRARASRGDHADAPAAPLASGATTITRAPTTRPGVTPTPRPTPAPVVASAPPPPSFRDVLPDADAARTSDGEGYEDHGVNGFVNPRQDALSTFSIDVDTASYAITRRKLREGYLPPEAAVRAEEFVNYLPYDYRNPDEGDPFAVDFEGTVSPYNPRNRLIRVGVQGRRVEMAERAPVHLTFLVDVSGSMRSSDKLGLVKESLMMLTEELDDGDTVAIATYAGATQIVLEPTPLRDEARIFAALDALSAGGSTAMASGIDLAYRLADQSYVSGHVNRVVIASDGDANVGQTSHSALSAHIRGYADRGITLTTLGFGNGNYQDTMMEQLANDGDGNYYYIDTRDEARRVLVDRLTGTLEVIAKDVKIQVEWDPQQVLAYRLIGYENRDVADVDFRNDAVDAGEIGAGHQVTALYEVALADGARGSLATVRVRNKAPGPNAPSVERAFELNAKALGTSFGAASDDFRIATAAAGFAEILRGSPHMAEVSLGDVLAIARQAQRAEHREDAELVELIDRAAKLRGDVALVAR